MVISAVNSRLQTTLWLFGEVRGGTTEICAALAAGNTEALQQTAHRLMNTVLYLGAPAAQQAAEDVSHLARSNNLTEAPCAVQHLEAELTKLKMTLRANKRPEP